jgi:hypothetical protein
MSDSRTLPDHLRAAEEVLYVQSSINDVSNLTEALYASINAPVQFELYTWWIASALTDGMIEQTKRIGEGIDVTFVNELRGKVVYDEIGPQVKKFASMQECWKQELLPLLIKYTDLVHEENVGDLIWLLNSEQKMYNKVWDRKLYPYIKQFIDRHDLISAGYCIWVVNHLQDEMTSVILPYMVGDNFVYANCLHEEKEANFETNFSANQDIFNSLASPALVARKSAA